jgi:hypothetical protein
LSAFLCLIAFSFSAQQLGNEWINYGQSYYKFKLHQNGFYRIPVSSLTNVGLPVSVQGDHLQVFKDGIEIPIFVSASAVLTSTDYIEFYGEKANGNLDKRLFQDTIYQLNPNQNLTSDTSYYFITFNSNPGHKRYVPVANNLNSLPTKENYCFVSQNLNYRNEFTSGPSATEGQYQLPELLNLNLSQYQKEGYVKKFTTAMDSVVLTCVNPYIDPAAPNATLNTTVVGRSYLNNHNMQVYANGNLLADTLYSRFDFIRLNRNVNMNSISGTNSFTFLYKPSGISSDRYGIVNLDFKYPATFDFANATSYSFQLEPQNSIRYIEVVNFNKGGFQPRLYNHTASTYLVGDTSVAGIIRFALPASLLTQDYTLQSSQTAALNSVQNLSSVVFKNFTQPSQQGNFIIITDSRYTNDGNGNNHVEAYRAYRSSVAGGNYQAVVAFVHDIYNEFGYGYEYSSLAMKNFIQFASTHPNWTNTPKHAFIIGKGIEYNAFLSYKASSFNSFPFYAVPTFGQPGSDLLLTDFNKNDKPMLSIGRLSAFNANDIKTYLDKVKDHELDQNSAQHNADTKLWSKRVLHIAGATDPAQLSPILDALIRQKTIISKPNFGGNAVVVAKSNSAEQESINNTTIDSMINNGSGIVQFFGHSSASTIDYGLDFPEKYTNYKKYPLIIANGCGAGNIFLYTGQKYLSERFLFTPNAGAIGFLASVNTGFSGYLGFYTDSLYGRMATSMSDQSIGSQLINNVTSLISLPNFNNDFLFKMHTHQIILNGDPAIKVMNSTSPDYSVELNDVKLSNNDLTLAMDSFDMEIKYHNLGKYTIDSVELNVQRRLSDNSLKTIYFQKVPGFSYEHIIKLKLPILGEMGKGTNQFLISIDKTNTIEEKSNTNNEVTKSVYIRGGGISPVYPHEFSIINNQGLTLKASTMNPFEDIQNYIFELDTTAQFNSPIKSTQQITSSGGVVKWTPSMLYQDSVVYYWRVAVDDATNRWEGSSFIYLASSSTGWNQSHYDQFTRNEYNSIELDSASRKFNYTSTNKLLQVQNVCMNGASPYTYIWPEYLVKMNGSTLYTFGCDPYPGYSSLQFVVIDTLTGMPWLNTRPDPNVAMGKYGSFDPCRITNAGIKEDPFFEFSFLSANSRKLAMDFIDAIPSGYYVMIQPRLCVGSGCGTVNTTFVSHWKADTATLGSNVSLYHKIKNMGFTTIDSFYKNRPMIMWTKKNEPNSVKQYVGADATVKLYGEFEYNILNTIGSIKTPKIGPASTWTEFKSNLYTNDMGIGDTTRFMVYGVKNSNEDILLATIKNDTSLAFIDANLNPFLKVVVNQSDVNYRTPEQLQYWRILFVPKPEAALNPAAMYTVENTAQPEVKKIKFAIENLTDMPMDSMLISFSIYDRFNTKISTVTKRYKPLPGADTIHVEYDLSTENLYSNMKFEIELNPLNNQIEQFHPNNFGLRTLSFLDPTLPLPVALRTFDIVETDCSTKITWTTSDEINFSHYVVERKQTNAFIPIATIPAIVFNDEITQSYTCIDELPTPSIYSYRLKMVDVDSKFAISPTKSIRISCNENYADIQLYPNPASTFANVMIKNDNERFYTIKILNTLGQVLYTSSIEVLNETKVINLPVANLPSGIYSIIITDDGNEQKVIKMTKE